METRLKTNVESQKRPSPLKSGWSGEIEKAKDSKSFSSEGISPCNENIAEARQWVWIFRIHVFTIC